MCGIAGYIGNDLFYPKKKNISDCIKFLKRRGPDNYSFHSLQSNKKKLFFLHTRLSIIDIHKSSNQPFKDSDGVLIYNGMIYNYIELRNNLKKLGVKFNTFSDTEVLLKLLNLYKEKAFSMLDGMWSVSYYNIKSKCIYLSRDRFGQKPLYYQMIKNNLFYSNSISALCSLTKKKLIFNEKKINELLSYPDKIYGVNNETLFSGINQFPQGKFLVINLNENKFQLKFKDYWKLKICKKNISFSSSCKKLKKIITRSVKTHIRSDVNNSVLVSGGIDSNSIVSIVNKIMPAKGYSLLSSNKKYDEKKQIKDSEKFNKFKTKFIKSKSNDALKLLEDIINNSYNILLTPTALALALICKKISSESNRVLLTGIGGDELFCGYYINYLSHIASYKNKSKFKEKFEFWEKNIKNFIRNENLKNFEEAKKKKNKYNLNFYTEGNSILKKYLKNPVKPVLKKLSNDIFYNNMLQNIYFQSIPSQLLQTDLVTMYFSLEARSPFLSHHFFDFVYSLNKDFFMFKGQPKSLLRNAMKNNLPESIYKNYEKIGFYSPVMSFFSARDVVKIKTYLKRSKILKKQLIRDNFLELLKKKNDQISHEESKFLFICLNIAILEKNVY